MGAKVFYVRASKLGKRWDVSFHALSELSLPRKAKHLEHVARILRGVSVPSKEYLERSQKRGVFYIRISDISNGQIVSKAAKRVPAIFGKVRLRIGDILLSIRGSIGKTALVTEQFEGAVPSSQLAVIRPYEGVIDREYLWRILSSETVQKQLEQLKVGQFITGVPLSGLRRVLIPLHSLQDQLRIVKKVEELEELYLKASQEREKIKHQIDQTLEGEIS